MTYLTLQYKRLYNINRSEKWGKKIQTAGYIGAGTVVYDGVFANFFWVWNQNENTLSHL